MSLHFDVFFYMWYFLSKRLKMVLEWFFFTCPCMFMMTTVLVLLHTTILSGFFGNKCTELTLTLPPAEAPMDLKVFKHSVVLLFQTLTVPSELAEISWWPSKEVITLLTYEVWPRNSFKVLPDLRPCVRTVVSNEAEMIWELSLEKRRQVMPFEWAFSNLRKHWPVVIFHTRTCPDSEPEANISESREKVKHKTASSIIIKFSCAWYFKSLRILPVVKFQTSINPSTDPDTKYWPSGEKVAHSICDLAPNLICLLIIVGNFSSSCSRIAALPRNKSIWVPKKENKIHLHFWLAAFFPIFPHFDLTSEKCKNADNNMRISLFSS